MLIQKMVSKYLRNNDIYAKENLQNEYIFPYIFFSSQRKKIINLHVFTNEVVYFIITYYLSFMKKKITVF